MERAKPTVKCLRVVVADKMLRRHEQQKAIFVDRMLNNQLVQIPQAQNTSFAPPLDWRIDKDFFAFASRVFRVRDRSRMWTVNTAGSSKLTVKSGAGISWRFRGAIAGFIYIAACFSHIWTLGELVSFDDWLGNAPCETHALDKKTPRSF